jgi:hypothetical protein
VAIVSAAGHPRRQGITLLLKGGWESMESSQIGACFCARVRIAIARVSSEYCMVAGSSGVWEQKQRSNENFL